MAELANIDDRGVELRLSRAVYGVAVTLVVMVAMTKLHAPTWSFVLLFIPFFGTANLAFQGLYRT